MEIAVAAMVPEDVEPATNLPRGAMICLPCGVSWNGFQAAACWSCGQPGITTAVAGAQRSSEDHPLLPGI